MGRLSFAGLVLLASPLSAQYVPAPTDADDVSGQVEIRRDHEATGLVLPALPHGTYILIIPESGDATVSLARDVKLVGPGPAPAPQPSTLTDRAKAIKAAADKVTGDPNREGTAKAIAALYREVAKQAKGGSLKDTAAVSELGRLGTDMLLVNLGAAAKTDLKAPWQPVRDVLTSQLNAAAQEGKTVAEFAALYEEAASGLDASAPNRAIDPAIIQLILEILKLILPLIIK